MKKNPAKDCGTTRYNVERPDEGLRTINRSFKIAKINISLIGQNTFLNIKRIPTILTASQDIDGFSKDAGGGCTPTLESFPTIPK